MNGLLAAKRCSRYVAATVRNHLIHVHIELGAASGHPHMKRERVLMLSGKDLVTGLNNQLVLQVSQPFPVMIGYGSGLFERGIRADHLARHQVFADTEMLEGALGLWTPQFIRRDLHLAEAIGLHAKKGRFGTRVPRQTTTCGG